MRPNTLADFWALVDKRGKDECWPWTGETFGFGYGRFRLDGERWMAHRLMWTVTHGEIPDGLCVCHKCDVPGCMNDAHYFLGSNAENQFDKIIKGRQAKGDRNGARTQPESRARGDRHWTRLPEHADSVTRGETQHLAKLKDSDIPRIRTRRASGESLISIARDYHVTLQTIWAVDKRITWKHIKDIHDRSEAETDAAA